MSRKENRKRVPLYKRPLVIGGAIGVLVFVVLLTYKYVHTDYSRTQDLEHALDIGESVEGKTVTVFVDTTSKGVLGSYYVQTNGSDITYISSEDPEVKEGSAIVITVNRVEPVLNSWFVYYTPGHR